MAKKTKFPNSLKNTKEDKEFSQAWEEAIIVDFHETQKKVTEAEIENLQSFVPKTPKESIEKEEALWSTQQRLKTHISAINAVTSPQNIDPEDFIRGM